MFCWSWSSYDSYSWYYDLTYARENQSACIQKSGKISNISWYSLYFFYIVQFFFENLVPEMQGWRNPMIILQVYLNSHAVLVLQTLLYHVYQQM